MNKDGVTKCRNPETSEQTSGTDDLQRNLARQYKWLEPIKSRNYKEVLGSISQ